MFYDRFTGNFAVFYCKKKKKILAKANSSMLVILPLLFVCTCKSVQNRPPATQIEENLGNEHKGSQFERIQKWSYSEMTGPPEKISNVLTGTLLLSACYPDNLTQSQMSVGANKTQSFKPIRKFRNECSGRELGLLCFQAGSLSKLNVTLHFCMTPGKQSQPRCCHYL